eukprot:scaffold28794_cov112-Isochrysis_galbana.AAC.1
MEDAVGCMRVNGETGVNGFYAHHHNHIIVLHIGLREKGRRGRVSEGVLLLLWGGCTPPPIRLL